MPFNCFKYEIQKSAHKYRETKKKQNKKKERKKTLLYGVAFFPFLIFIDKINAQLYALIITRTKENAEHLGG